MGFPEDGAHPQRQPYRPERPPITSQRDEMGRSDIEDLWPDEPARGSRTFLAAAGVAAIVLVAAAVTGYVMVSGPGADEPGPYDPKDDLGGSSVTEDKPTGAVSGERPGKEFGFAEKRSTDPEPLAVKELFGTKKIKGGFTRAVTRMDKKCENAVEGKSLTKAIKGTSCTQVVRASFASSKGDIIGTVGVANLKDGKEVAKLKKAWGQHDYVKPLPGKGPTAKLGSGEAQGGVFPHGHYAIMVWFQFKDGHSPSGAEEKKLGDAHNKITGETVYPALDERTTSGRPAG